MTTAALPTPELFFETMNAYQRTAALKAAIELDLFSHVAEHGSSAKELAAPLKASERGVRILCDYLVIIGFLTKSGDRYRLAPDAALFLSRRSPAYLGGTAAFLATPALVRSFDLLADTIRHGRVEDSQSTISVENPIWVEFARAMRPMMEPAAEMIADALDLPSHGPIKVLDLAAGHGAFGIAIARRHPNAEVVAVDWPAVVAVAQENAARAGVAQRHRALPGDAFAVEYGGGYDVALVTNFLHHFDEDTNVRLLRKIAAALKPGGRVAVLEFVPNEDRVSPPIAAAFSLMMLGSTPAGDAYTFKQLQRMLTAAGFRDADERSLAPMPQTLVMATV